MSTNTLSIGQVLKLPTQEVEQPSGEGEVIYTVQSGDSLYSIASKYGTTVDAIKGINNLSSNLLKIGQTLKIPGTSAVESTGYTTYQVVSGDSLYSIAKKYNTTVDAIKNLNNLTSNLISVGQVVKIPSTSVSQPTYLTYQVVSGDNLYSIARKYNTTVDEIKSINNLSTNTLSIGQVLKIPTTSGTSTNSDYFIYKVVSGDSLYSIAKKYNTTVDEIKNLNSLTSNLLSIGQSIKIPN